MNLKHKVAEKFIDSIFSEPKSLDKFMEIGLSSNANKKNLLNTLLNKFPDKFLKEAILQIADSDKLLEFFTEAFTINRDDLKKLNIMERFSKKFFNEVSFSQCGEDLIIRHLLKQTKLTDINYIDVGAFNPFQFSNTALLYIEGIRGINIEPNPQLFQDFITYRKEDINLNIGISDTESELDFFIMDPPTLSTFSKEIANEYTENEGHRLLETKKIKVNSLQNIINEYCENKFPELLFIDAEGVDELILKSINFEINFPKVICIETISYSTKGKGVKNKDLIDYICSKGYLNYADTNINTIFVKKETF